MKDETEDRLRSAFERMREEDQGSAPNFQVLLSRVRTRMPVVGVGRRRSLLVLAAAAAIGAIAIGLTQLRTRAPYPIDLAATGWRGPTDFLLTVAVDPALSTVPRLGATALPWRIP